MKTAIVTGASSGIGLSICKVILKLGYKVYGIGRDFSHCDITDDNFLPIICDLMNTSLMCEKIKRIRKENDIYILVNNAGVGYFGLHEELNPKKIHEIISTNVEAPFILTQLLLRDLKKNKGFVINISSITAKESSPHGCAYGASKAALTHFSNSLFDETRKYGVKITTIHPDMTQSNFYRNANFKENSDFDAHITPAEISSAVEMILTTRSGLVVREITLSPQKHMISKK